MNEPQNVPQQQQEDSKPLFSVGALVNALRRQWLPAILIFATVLGGSWYFTKRQKTIYEASGALIFKVDRAAQLASVNTASGSGSDANAPAAQPISLQNEELVLRSASVADEAIKKISFPIKREDILAGVKVEIGKGTDTLTISYKGSNAKEAAEIVNQMMKSYTENSLKVSKEETSEARKFIVSQLPKVLEDLRQSEIALQSFKEKNKVTALAQESTSMVSGAEALKQKILDTEVQLSSLQASSQDLRRRLGPSADRAVLLSKLSGSESVKQALGELQKVEGQLALQTTQYQGDHPSIKRLQRQQDNLQSLLRTRISEVVGSGESIPLSDLQVGGLELTLVGDLLKAENSRISLQQQLIALNSALNDSKERLKNIPKLEQEQQFLERKILINRTTFESLLKKQQELQLIENQKVNRSRILTEAVVPTQPVSPRVQNNLLLGGVLGTILAIAAAIALQSLDTLLRTTDQAKRVFGYDLLGTLPNFGKKWSGKPAVFVRANPNSPISESYRMLQTNLRFLSPTKPAKLVVITSSIPDEGKSTVAANFAAATAQLGKRTLLIDVDMRRPSQQSIWNISNNLGLSELLADQISKESAIQTVMPNLGILLAGTPPHNPLSLLDSNRMTALLQEFAEIYDYVIIDAPPLLAASDSRVLGKLADGILFVVRPDILNFADAEKAKTLLAQSNLKVLGMVVNGVASPNSSDYKYINRYYSDKEEPSSTPLVGYASYKKLEIKK
jgi:polysaccharide biosynthesis transport protein